MNVDKVSNSALEKVKSETEIQRQQKIIALEARIQRNLDKIAVLKRALINNPGVVELREQIEQVHGDTQQG